MYEEQLKITIKLLLSLIFNEYHILLSLILIENGTHMHYFKLHSHAACIKYINGNS